MFEIKLIFYIKMNLALNRLIKQRLICHKTQQPSWQNGLSTPNCFIGNCFSLFSACILFDKFGFLFFSDCSIVSSRVILLLDDLLWVLTETQLKAALLYATSLQEVIEKSTRQSKQLAAEKLKVGLHFKSGTTFDLGAHFELPFSDLLARFLAFIIIDVCFFLRWL